MPGFLSALQDYLDRKISTILLCTLITDLAFETLETAVLSKNDDPRVYYDLFSEVMLMLSTIYFAWNSLVKENAFELLSFLVFSSILNFHGIYIAATHQNYLALSYAAYVVEGLTQLIYYVSYYFAYQSFGWRMIRDAQTTNMVLLSAYKMYETFVSVLKVDFILCLFMYATYIYYIILDWPLKALEFCLIATGILLIIVAYFILGMVSVIKEKKAGFVLFMMFLPVCEALKVYFAVTILLAPGTSVETFILVQFMVVAGADLVAALLVLGLGLLLLKSFNQGLREILLRVEKKGIVKPFIS